MLHQSIKAYLAHSIQTRTIHSLASIDFICIIKAWQQANKQAGMVLRKQLSVSTSLRQRERKKDRDAEKKERDEMEIKWVFGTLKCTPSNIYPTMRSHLLIISKKLYKVGTENSNTCHCRGHCHSNIHSSKQHKIFMT